MFLLKQGDNNFCLYYWPVAGFDCKPLVHHSGPARLGSRPGLRPGAGPSLHKVHFGTRLKQGSEKGCCAPISQGRPGVHRVQSSPRLSIYPDISVAQMRAVLIQGDKGGVEKLFIGEAPKPTPSANEVLVGVRSRL